MALHYKSCGLANVWLKSGYKAHETKYGTSYSYEDIDGLYRAIAIQLCVGQRKIEPDALRFLRKRLGYSQGELGAELGYTSQAVAKWEKGTSKIPVAVARLVRLLCLNKFSPRKSLHDAFEAINTLSVDRLEFEYTNSIWKVVGAEVVMPDIQINSLAYIDLKNCVSNDSFDFVESYSPQNGEFFSAIDIPQGKLKIDAFRAGCADEVIYNRQIAKPIRTAVSASATTHNLFKLDANSITRGTC